SCSAHPCSVLLASVQLAIPTVAPPILQPVPETGSNSTSSWPVYPPLEVQLPKKMPELEVSVQTVAPFGTVKQLSLSISTGASTSLPLALHFSTFVPARTPVTNVSNRSPVTARHQ